MATADEVDVILTARTRQYEADLERSRKTFDRTIGAQKNGIVQFERQMRQSSAAISSQIKGLASTFAAAFTGRELVGLLDSFTRLQNNLRVAGVAGDQMKAVQDRLFASAQKYGVELEGLSKLFSTLSQASKELGATQEQVFGVTDSVSAALKVSGVSAQEASGALLQLGQALRGGKVQAEEYNSLLDGLYPLLEAAAAGSAKWGGSVAKLTTDVKAGKVSSQEFFNAILAGSSVLEGKASKAALTLSSGFTTLSNALTVYFGEADKANGVSAALGSALGKLADNLDTLIPALAAVGTALGVGFVVNATRARVATMALGAASVGAAGAMGTLGFAAGSAGRVLLGAFGGPIGAAILAIGAAIYYVATASTEAEAAAQAFARGQQIAASQTQSAANAADKLASAHGRARAEALALARAEAENIKQKLASARASLVLAQAEAARQVQARPSSKESAGSPVGAISRGTRALTNALFPSSARPPAADRVDELKGQIDSYQKALSGIGAQINAVATPKVSAAGAGPKPRSTRAGPSGPSPEDVAHRFDAERAQLMEQYNQALGSMATTAEEEAELELRSVELARVRARADIKANDDFDKAQKKQLNSLVDHVAEVERERVDRQKVARLEQERADLLQTDYDIQRDELDTAREAASTNAERRRIGQAMVDLEYELKRQLLEQVIASESATASMKARARLTLENLPGAKQRASESNVRDTGGPIDDYLRRTDPAKNAERAEQLVVDELDHVQQGITSALSKAVGSDDPLITGLINMLLEQILFRPLAEALQGGMGGLGGGGLGNILGSVFGGFFASGGRPPVGKVSIVGERGPELFVPNGAGTIIPNHALNVPNRALNAQNNRPQQVTVVVQANDYFDAKVAHISGQVSNQAVSAAAPHIVGAAVSQANRSAPAAVQYFQRNGTPTGRVR